MERVARNRSVEYKIVFIQRQREAYIYIGSMWSGRIVYGGCDPRDTDDSQYGIYLQLPGMWGPVGKADDISTAKLIAVEAIKRWLAKFTDSPEPPPEHLVKALAKQDKDEAVRVRRTRTPVAAPATVRRVSRTR